MRWLYLNGEIIGVEIDGIEYNLTAIFQDPVLHQAYHDKLKEDDEQAEKR